MWNRPFFCLLASVLLCNCEKPAPPVPVKPTPTATPTPAPTPSPSPSPTPQPTPQARLAPPGVFYVVRAFSVTTDEGIHGFRPGKEVRLVKEESTTLLVTDGVIEGRAPKECFTNDLDVIDSIRDEERRQVALVASVRNQQNAEYRAQLSEQFSRQEEAKQFVEAHRSPGIDKLIKEREKLDARIQKARDEIMRKGDPKNKHSRSGFGFGSNNKIVSWSADASDFDNLLRARDRLEQQIQSLLRE